MNDAYFRDKLSAYLDNELPPDERQIVEQYLATHPEAHKILDELRKLNAFVDSQATLRDDLYWEKSAKKIEQRLGIGKAEAVQTSSSAKGWSATRWTATVAAAASIAFIAYIGLRDREHIEQKVQTQMQSPALPATTNQSAVDTMTQKKDAMSNQSAHQEAATTVDSLANVQRSPKLQTVDKRPILATEKDSATSLQKKKEIPAETASGSAQEAPSVAVPSPAMKSAERQAFDQSEAESNQATASQYAAESLVDELSALRHERDSLLALGKGKLSSGVNNLSGQSKPLTFKGSLAPEKADRALLLPIWYQIAKLSSDSTERQMSIDSLRFYTTNKNDLLRSQANSYLDSLGVGKSDSTIQK